MTFVVVFVDSVLFTYCSDNSTLSLLLFSYVDGAEAGAGAEAAGVAGSSASTGLNA